MLSRFIPNDFKPFKNIGIYHESVKSTGAGAVRRLNIHKNLIINNFISKNLTEQNEKITSSKGDRVLIQAGLISQFVVSVLTWFMFFRL